MRVLRLLSVGFLLAAAATGAGAAVQEPQEWPWGEAKGGLQSRVCFEKRVYKQGEPIVCWIEVRNASDQPVRYDGRAGASLQIADPHGKAPPDIAEYWQMGGPSPDDDALAKIYAYPTIRPGQVLDRGRNRLDTRLYMREPGVYRFRWPGAEPLPPQVHYNVLMVMEISAGRAVGDEAWRKKFAPPPDICAFPPAPEVTIKVVPAPGGGPDGDIVGRILRVLPPGWRVNGASLLSENVAAGGRPRGRGSRLWLAHHPVPNVTTNSAFVRVWVMAERDADAAGYLGSGKLGHVYLRGAEKSPSRWGHLPHDIATALAVENPPPKPPGPDWGRAISYILRACHERSKVSHDAFGLLCTRSDLKPREGDVARLSFQHNLATASKAKPWARKDPKAPYYEVHFSAVPSVRPAQPSPWDTIVEWESGPGRKGQVWYRVVSDDGAFRKALTAILDGEVRRALGQEQREGKGQ